MPVLASKRAKSAAVAAALVLVVAGAWAGLVTSAIGRPDPGDDERLLWQRPFQLARKATDPFRVTPMRWLEVPWLFGDFDLTAELELGPATQLAILLRRVEPRPVGNRRALFHGRFSVLNLSTERAGPPWQGRDDAVLRPAAGGVELAPGIATTLWVQARGRALRANVAGRWLEPHEALDEHGSLALLVRSGSAAVRTLTVTPLSAAPPGRFPDWLPSWLPGWGIGALAGAVLATAGLGLGVGWLGVVLAAAALALAATGAASVVGGALPPLARVEPLHALSMLLAGVPCALALLLLRCRLRWLVVPAAAASLLLVLLPAEAVQRRFAADPELDAVFGEQAGEGLAEALALRLRGPLQVHVPQPATHRALLLGGQLLYQRGAAPEDHIEPLLLGELRRRADPTADVVCLPTVDGHTAQQWQLFTRFFTAYRPRWLVFGVPADEAAPGPDGKPRSSPAQLAAQFAAARDYCSRERIKLVVLLADGLVPELRAALREQATGEVRLVEIQPGQAPAQIAQLLADALADD